MKQDVRKEEERRCCAGLSRCGETEVATARAKHPASLSG